MIENISSKKTELQLKFILKKKDLKSKVRRINLTLILLNQLKWILSKLFRILRGRDQHSSDVLSDLAHSLKAQRNDVYIVACIPIFNTFILIKIKIKQDKIDIHESIQISHVFCLDRVSQTAQNITTLYYWLTKVLICILLCTSLIKWYLFFA